MRTNSAQGCRRDHSWLLSRRGKYLLPCQGWLWCWCPKSRSPLFKTGWRISSACPGSFCHSPRVGLVPKACFTEDHTPHIRFWGERRKLICARTAILKRPWATSVASEWGPEWGPSGDPGGTQAGAGARPRADGGAALHSSGRRAPASRIPGGKRDPSGSLHMPQIILRLPSATAPSPPPAPLCHKGIFSITTTLVPPVIPLPLCPSPSSGHCSQRKSLHTDCGTGCGELEAACSRHRNTRVK